MRIVISGRAAVYPKSDVLPSDPTAVLVTDATVLQALDGYDGDLEDDLADDIDRSLCEAGVRGGDLTFAYDRGRNELRVVSEYSCRRLLTADELAALVEETVGAWIDGVGEMEVEWQGGSGHLYSYLPGGGDQDVRAEQLPD